jgi:predicted MPP superfamily phosphohydrolase
MVSSVSQWLTINSRKPNHIMMLFARMVNNLHILPYLKDIIALGALSGVGATVLTGPWRLTGLKRRTGLGLALTFGAFALSDVLLLMALPRLGLSYSYWILVPALAALLVRVVMLWSHGAGSWLLNRRAPTSRLLRWGPGLFLVANLLFSAIQVRAYVIEPFWLETTHYDLGFVALDTNAPPLRIVHLTDLHIERTTGREIKVVDRVNALQPDLVVITGDLINTSYLDDPTAHDHWRWFVNQLDAPYGIYVTRGTVEPSQEYMAQLVRGTTLRWLENEHVVLDIRGQRVALVGVATSHDLGRDVPRLDRALAGVPGDALTVLLYHSPDLVLHAAQRGVDLYLGGHTHGGQIRLPFYGAVVTGSLYGRRYVSGLFQEGEMTMIISRGLGFEGGAAPRARFLCRPQIVSLTLQGVSMTLQGVSMTLQGASPTLRGE